MTRIPDSKKPRQIVRVEPAPADVIGASWSVRVKCCPLAQFNGWHFPKEDTREDAQRLASDLRRDIRDQLKRGVRSVEYVRY